MTGLSDWRASEPEYEPGLRSAPQEGSEDRPRLRLALVILAVVLGLILAFLVGAAVRGSEESPPAEPTVAALGSEAEIVEAALAPAPPPGVRRYAVKGSLFARNVCFAEGGYATNLRYIGRGYWLVDCRTGRVIGG